MIDADDMASSILEDLRAFGHGPGDAHRPTAQEVLGVYMADLRKVVAKVRTRLAGENGDDVYALGLALLAKNVSECRQVAYELIAGHREARESLDVTRIEALGEGIDNWVSVDGFCCFLVGRAWRDGRISDAAILRWARSSDLWWRRAAVVATVPLNLRSSGGTGDTTRTLMICRQLAGDPEVMVQKAISWALRTLIHWDRGAVEAFLETHGERVSALVRREVTKKLTTGKKNG